MIGFKHVTSFLTNSSEKRALPYLRNIKSYGISDIKKARKEYYKNKFAAFSNCPKKIWKCLNDLLGSTTSHVPSTLTFNDIKYSGGALADKFNEHFLSSGEPLDTQDKKREISQYIASPLVSSIFLKPCSEHEVIMFLSNLDKATAAGANEIKAEPITAVADLISLPLQHICDEALDQGVFPDCMKISTLIVLHKGGPYGNINNYRPYTCSSLAFKTTGIFDIN